MGRGTLRAQEGHRSVALRACVVAILAVLAMLPTTGTADAGETETFRWEPYPLQVQGRERSAFQFDVPVGGQIRDTVALTNKTDEVRSFRVYGSDASQESAGIAVETFGATDDGVGAWITLDQAEVTLLPRETATIPFMVRRPEGEHTAGLGAVVAEEIREAPRDAGINVVFRLAIVVDISGDAAGVRVSDPALDIPLQPVPSAGTASALVSNGTLQDVAVEVALQVQGLTGSVWTLPRTEVTLRPGEARTVEVPWTNVPRWGGIFRVEASADWQAGTVTVRGDRRLYPPLWLLAMAILAVGIRALREMWSRGGRGRGQGDEPAPDPDALRGRLIETALWLHAAGRDAPAELRETAVAESRAIAARAKHAKGAEDVERAARSLETFARGLESGDGSARRAASDLDGWIREHRDDPRVKELVRS